MPAKGKSDNDDKLEGGSDEAKEEEVDQEEEQEDAATSKGVKGSEAAASDSDDSDNDGFGRRRRLKTLGEPKRPKKTKQPSQKEQSKYEDTAEEDRIASDNDEDMEWKPPGEDAKRGDSIDSIKDLPLTAAILEQQQLRQQQEDDIDMDGDANGAAATTAGGSGHGVSTTLGTAAAVHGLGWDAAQTAFQPSSTPAEEKRRFLAWNLVGAITTRDEGSHNFVEVQFSDAGAHRPIRFTDTVGYTGASLSSSNVAFIAPKLAGDTKSLASLKYFPLSSWSLSGEWEVSFDKKEDLEGVASGHNWAAVATTKQCIRLFDAGGAQGIPFRFPGQFLAMTGHGPLLAVFYHQVS